MAQRGSDVRRASMSEVDVALTELAEERDDRREHNRPADNRYADGLDPACEASGSAAGGCGS